MKTKLKKFPRKMTLTEAQNNFTAIKAEYDSDCAKKKLAACKRPLKVDAPKPVAQMVYKRLCYAPHTGAVVGYSYTIYERDIPRIVEAFSKAILLHRGIPYSKVARAQLRAIGIETP